MTNLQQRLAAAALVVSTGGVLAAQQAVVIPVPAVLQRYAPVTVERLLAPEDGNVLMVRRTYNGWGYSPLKQVTTANVSQLQPVWSFATGNTSGHEATPLVNNGVMFVATPGNQVLALDAKTGKEVWSTEVEKNRNGYYMSMAPLVADGKVIVGTSGGELGVRGFVAAYDPDTGKQLWKVFTIPAPGEPGSETWPTGDQRPGDNLYTSSTIAIDVTTGTIKGHHQYDPNESWDWDEVSPPRLIDYQRNGRAVKGLVNIARDGYMWFLERTDGPDRLC